MSFSHSSGIHISGGTFYTAARDVNIQNNQQLAIQSTSMLGDHSPTQTPLPRLGSEGAFDIPTPSPSGPDRNHRNVAGSERFLPYNTATRRPPSSQISVPPDTSRATWTRSDAASPAAPESSGYPSPRDVSPRVLPAPAYNTLANHQASTIINGGLFVSGNVNNIQTNGIDILRRHVVLCALHNSGESFIEPACHPGTRSAILNQLRDWSLHTSTTRLLWLCGTAGAGKSAIAQTFAGMCQEEDRLGGSFFFKRGHEQRGTCDGLFATLAFQLTQFSSDLDAAIRRVVEADTLLVGRTLSVQLHALFVSVFKQIPPPHPLPVVVIDGLDECRDRRIQTHLLQLLIGAIREHQLPVRILIVSRPEPHIRDFLGDQLDVCGQLELRADESSYNDIRIYFCAEFARIRHEFSRIPRDHSPSGTVLENLWPLREELDHLVHKSSGVFVYASTIVRFVDDKCSHPYDRLKRVLQLDRDSTAPLDDLYTEILSSVSNSNHPTLLRVLHAAFRFKFSLGPHEIDLLLDLPPGTARLSLHGLQSIISIPPALTRLSGRQAVVVQHESLRDYFLDLDRSRTWCLSTHALDLVFAHHACVLSDVSKLLSPAQVFDFLRNEHVQRLWFGSGDYSRGTSELVRKYLQRFPSIPADLSKTITDSDFIVQILENLVPRQRSSHSTCRFDSIYMTIFSDNPLLLDVLRIQLIDGPAYGPVLLDSNLRALDCTYTVFRPFCAFNGLIDVSFPDGDSPFDFLSDSQRAGDLYEDPHHTSEKVIIRWIRVVKEFLAGDDFYPYDLLNLSRMLLHEIQTFDLAALFPLLAANLDEMHAVNPIFLQVPYFNCVIDWLHLFSEPPIEAIKFWERQRSDACQFWDWVHGRNPLEP
ncbi:hypothetical protein C8R44DRAFT_849899 [Mycena epipterygia]|nr:hypothetical protein C8R44DRAFT_849899 [Mycena epipterygia]